MDSEQKNPQGGIINNFYGSITNYNIINGSATFNNSHEEKNKKRLPTDYTDEMISRAIVALNGKQKPLCEKQMFLGVIKVLAAKCGWSSKWATSCDRINSLAIAETLEVKCDINNLKAPCALKFASIDYDEWEDYKPTNSESEVFQKNKVIGQLFFQELERQYEMLH